MDKSNEYESLREAILDGDREAAEAIGHDVVEVAKDLTEPVEIASGVIREVGDKFGSGELFLPEMVLAAEAMQAFMDVVTPRLEAEASDDASTRGGKVVIGTVQGDIHSIGKNIVATMLSASGYEVVDLGVNVVPMDAIKAAESTGASIIGLSALMTTSMPYQKEERDDFWIIVGGGPVTRDYADDINANGWAPDAAAAVQVCDHMLSSETTPASTDLIYKAAE